jgi:hypothetical protein
MRKRLARKNAKSRAQRAQERDKVRSLLEGETMESDGEDSEEQGEERGLDERESEVETPLRNINGRERKRRKDVSFEPWEGTRKKARYEGTDSVSSFHRTSFFGASEFSVKRIGSLGYQRPNPMNLARSSWLPKTYHEDDATSDSEDESLDGPEADTTRPLISDTDSGDAKNWRKSFSRGPNAIDDEDLAVSVGALTFKPTPGNYAKRRWSSEVWASNAARDSSPKGSDRSDVERTSPEYSDDEGSIDVNVDYKKRYSIYFITQRDAGSDNSSSNEEVCFNYAPHIFNTDI